MPLNLPRDHGWAYAARLPASLRVKIIDHLQQPQRTPPASDPPQAPGSADTAAHSAPAPGTAPPAARAPPTAAPTPPAPTHQPQRLPVLRRRQPPTRTRARARVPGPAAASPAPAAPDTFLTAYVSVRKHSHGPGRHTTPAAPKDNESHNPTRADPQGRQAGRPALSRARRRRICGKERHVACGKTEAPGGQGPSNQLQGAGSRVPADPDRPQHRPARKARRKKGTKRSDGVH